MAIIRGKRTEGGICFQTLSETQCAEVVDASKEILETTGIVVQLDEALEIYRKAGCLIDGNRVRIPRKLVEYALDAAPSTILLYDRDGTESIRLEGYNSYFGPGPTNPFFIDVETGERKPVLRKDVKNTAVLCDALPNIDFVMSLAGLTDVPGELADVYEMYTMVQHTKKPIVGWANDLPGLKFIVEMGSIVSGSLEAFIEKPFFAIYSGDPVTPLVHIKDALRKLLYMAELGLPVIYPPGLQMGANAPMSMAGMLALGTADNLAGLLLTQLKNEGTPFIGGIIPSIMDMMTTNCSYGAPEMFVGHAAAADIYHFLKIPMWSTAGATDSKLVDQQSAIEAALSCYTTAMSGANLIHDVGFIEGAMAASLEQVVMCDEIIGMVKKMSAGIDTSRKAMALDIIDEVGPGGTFLAHEHTCENLRTELWFPTVMDRKRHNAWENDGSLSMGDRLNAKAKKILNSHQPPKLSDNIKIELDKCLERADKALRVLKP